MTSLSSKFDIVGDEPGPHDNINMERLFIIVAEDISVHPARYVGFPVFSTGIAPFSVPLLKSNYSCLHHNSHARTFQAALLSATQIIVSPSIRIDIIESDRLQLITAFSTLFWNF